ncbi:MAG: DUF167 domain-containing protein [Pseudomonadota bacterium]
MTDTGDRTEILAVRVTPKASSNRVIFEKDQDGSILAKVYVTTAPDNGKANAAVLKLLAKTLGVPKSALVITHGHKSRDKTIQIQGRTKEITTSPAP